MTESVRYSDVLAVRVAPELREAIQALAARAGTKPAEWARRALWTVIALQGNDDNPDVRADGKRRYARLEGGALTDVIYREPTP